MSKPKAKSRSAKPKAAPAKATKPTKAAGKPAPKSTPRPPLKSAPKVGQKSTSKPSSKTPPKTSAKAEPSHSIMDSAQSIWLAGLGAFGKAQEEGGKLFKSLVKEGSELEQKTRKIATGAAGDVRGAMAASASQVRERTQESWDRLEQVFEHRVSTALAKLNIPGRKEFDELTKRIEELSKEARKSTIGMGVKTGFGNVMTTSVRRARDDLNDLARELEEAQLAAKQAEKKGPAKKK